jgi:glycosyltransferase involved in cell wall biosynthesis
VRLAYVVSRFPHVTETFILRELDAVASDAGVDAELLSLFPPVDATVHRTAQPWLAVARRPGAAEAVVALAKWLRRRPLRTLTSLLVVVRGHARRPGTLVRALATVPVAAAHAARVETTGTDHVHAHFATYPALTAWWCWRLTGVPFSFTVHAHDIFMDQSLLARKVADATFVIAISRYNARFLAPYATGSTTPIHLVHCGIDPSVYDCRPRHLPAEGPVRALCVAALREYKGHAVLLRALAEAGDRLARLELDLVGGGELRGDLERMVEDLGLTERVRFHGSRTEDDVRAFMRDADLFVLPSIVDRAGSMEGLPIVLMEALASGLPVVATRLSGIPEIVVEGVTGVLAEAGDAASLRATLERVLAEPDEAARWGHAGRALVEAEFDVRDVGARLRELFATSAATR